MLNQIYFNNSQFTQLINAIGGGGGTSAFDIVNIPVSDFSFNNTIYAYYADIPTGVNISDIVAIEAYGDGQVLSGLTSIYDNKIWVQLYSPYNNYKGDGTDTFICNVIINQGGV